MESTASFIITSTLVLGFILAILIFLLLKMEHKPVKRKMPPINNSGPKRPNPPYVINIKSNESRAFGAICIMKRDIEFNYGRDVLREVQNELSTIKSSIELMKETPYDDIRQSRYLAILHTLDRLKNLTSLKEGDLITIKDELKRYKNSM